MDDDERNRLFRAWRDAERAYRDEVTSHIDWAFTDEPPASAVPLTAEAFEELARRRDDAAAAQDAYRAAAW